MIFNYIYYNKKEIYNSSEFIEEYFALKIKNFILPTDDEFNQLYESAIYENYIYICNNYNDLLDNIIRKFNEPILSDLIDKLRDLRADSSYLTSKIRNSKLDEILR
jgi:hypothetical protein